MYRLEYLPSAKRDMADIVRYISRELANPVAAERLANDMIKAAERLTGFPYSCPAHYPLRPLEHEYRRLSVRNYVMFYYVDEKQKLVVISRVIYARRNYSNMPFA